MVLSKLDHLKNQRKTIDGQLERLDTWAREEGPQAAVYMFEAKLNRLDRITAQFEEIQQAIEDELTESKSSTDNEIVIRQTVEDILSQLTADLFRLKQQAMLNSSGAVMPHANDSHVSVDVSSVHNLKPIELPKFDGDFEAYIPFKATFDALVHDCPSPRYSDLQKFALLRDACTGRALDAIRHLIMTPESYDVARKILQERFHKKRLIFDALIRKLFSASKAKNVSELRKLSDLFDSQWKALGILTQSQYRIGEGVLIHLAKEKCDVETVRKWEEKIAMTDNIPTWTEFSTFLQQRCSTLESMNFATQPTAAEENKNKPNRYFKNRVSNAANATDTNCPCCNGKCGSVEVCDKFSKMPVDERFLLVRRENLCARCLLKKPHSNCLDNQCTKCQRTHNTLLHFDDPVLLQEAWKKAKVNDRHFQQVNSLQNEDIEDLDYDEELSFDSLQRVANAAEVFDFSSNYTWLATALIEIKNNENNNIIFRALLNAGSQISIITSHAFKRLGLTAKKHWSAFNRREWRLLAAIHDNLHQRHPGVSLNVSDWKIPNHIKLADPEFSKRQNIDIILGADVFYRLLGNKCIKIGPGKPDLIYTHLGWIIAGPMNLSLEPPKTFCTLTSFISASAEAEGIDPMELDSIKACWELEAVPPVQVKISPEEQQFLDHFKATTQFSKGRYTVRLPFKTSFHQLRQSKEGAMARLLSVQRKMKRDKQYKTMYEEFMAEYERLGHMEEVIAPDPTTPHYYIPHFAVWNLDSSTTQLRVVFDASCATSTGVALNDLLMAGPTVQRDLFAHLLNVRTKRYMLTGDISKMYRQVEVHRDDRKFQLILWCRPGESVVRTFALKTVTYGTTSAPGQSVGCLQDLADRYHDLPIGSKTLRESFYVDDMMSGADSVDETLAIYHQTTELLARGGFKLRKFQSNSVEVMRNIPQEEHGSTVPVGPFDVIKTLGLNWEPVPDLFTFYYEGSIDENLTRRTVLSQASRHFDPLGLCQPISVRAKAFVQHLWACNTNKKGSGWDLPLNDSLAEQWTQIRSELMKVCQVSVPRSIFPNKKKRDVQIHGCCDASGIASATMMK